MSWMIQLPASKPPGSVATPLPSDPSTSSHSEASETSQTSQTSQRSTTTSNSMTHSSKSGTIGRWDVRREESDCEAGKQFYRCGFNGFRGCCSVDPCHLDDCPDKPDLPKGVYISSGTFPDPSTETETMAAISEKTVLITTSASGETIKLTKMIEPGTEEETGSEITLVPPRQTADREDDAEDESTSEEPKPTREKTVTAHHPTTVVSITTSTTRDVSVSTTGEVSHQTHISISRASSESTSDISSSSKVSTTLSSGGTIDRGDVMNAGKETSNNSKFGGGLSPGAMGGIGAGACVLILLVTALALFLIKRHAAQKRAAQQDRPTSSHGASADDKGSLSSTARTPSMTGPFAPFGGRADGANPTTGTADMPAEAHGFPMNELHTESQPAELPGAVPSESLPRMPRVPRRFASVPGTRRNDPLATLNSTVNDEGRPAYVNHWSQYN